MKISVGDTIMFKGYTANYLYGTVKEIIIRNEQPVYICHYPNNPNSCIVVVKDKRVIEVM